MGLVAACDWALASEQARFCLSEVKVGVVAAVILPFVAQKIPPGEIRRWVLQAKVFSATEAREAGLVQRVVTTVAAEAAVQEEINLVLAGSPRAQRVFKALHQKVAERAFASWDEQQEHMEATIAQMRVSESGQHGIESFLNKHPPNWVTSLPAEAKLLS